MKTLTFDQWTELVERLVTDIRNNVPPPAPTKPLDVEAAATTLSADLPRIATQLQAHLGVVTAFADAMAAMDEAGVPRAAEAREIVLTAVPAFAKLKEVMPTLMWFVHAGDPAATGITGDHPS